MKMRKKIWMLLVVAMFLGGCGSDEVGNIQGNRLHQGDVAENIIDCETETTRETEMSQEEEITWKTEDTQETENGESGSIETESTETESNQEIETEPEQTQPETVEPEIIQITINATGDVTLGTNQLHTYKNSFHQYYDKYGNEYFLQNVKSIFEADDFTIVNLEGTLTESDNLNPKLWNHKGKPEYVSVLTCASVEAVSLGNNHIMDYNQEGADDTIKYVSEAGIEYALSGEWGNHYGLYETEKGIKIGFVSVNEHYDEANCYQWLGDGLKALREAGADLVIACNHWGGDKVYEPEPEQYLMGKWCIDMGYDLVLGCHPHVLQGIEYYNGKYIVHSMGNFCYGGNKNPSDKRSMIWQQTFTFVDGELQEESDVTVIPCRLSSVTNTNDYCPIVVEGDEAKEIIDHLNKYSEEFGVVFDYNGKHVKEQPEEATEGEVTEESTTEESTADGSVTEEGTIQENTTEGNVAE